MFVLIVVVWCISIGMLICLTPWPTRKRKVDREQMHHRRVWRQKRVTALAYLRLSDSQRKIIVRRLQAMHWQEFSRDHERRIGNAEKIFNINIALVSLALLASLFATWSTTTAVMVTVLVCCLWLALGFRLTMRIDKNDFSHAFWVASAWPCYVFSWLRRN